MYGYGRRNVYKSAEYSRWLSLADGDWLAQKPRGAFKGLPGAYVLTLSFHRPDKRRRDVGNLLKVAEDFLVRIKAVEDDSLCEDIRISWRNPNPGVLLVVESVR